MDTTDSPWTERLIEQVDWHWKGQLRPRLEGLTTEEYLWEPAPGSWNIHRRGEGYTQMQGGAGEFTIDFAFPEPQPAPVTTIAWRLGHIIVGVLAMRNAGHFGAPECDYMSWKYAGTADEALAQLDEQYATWVEGVRSWGDTGLEEATGPSEGDWAKEPNAVLVLHINRELVHHGAEIALLRDLHAHRDD